MNSFDAGLNVRNGFPVFSTLLEANFVNKQEERFAAFKLSDEDRQELLRLARDPRIGAAHARPEAWTRMPGTPPLCMSTHSCARTLCVACMCCKGNMPHQVPNHSQMPCFTSSAAAPLQARIMSCNSTQCYCKR